VPVNGAGFSFHPGSALSRQYQLRIGVTALFAFTVNGFNNARRLGGAQRSFIQVTEIAP
jgi:hypothetical protein